MYGFVEESQSSEMNMRLSLRGVIPIRLQMGNTDAVTSYGPMNKDPTALGSPKRKETSSLPKNHLHKNEVG